MANPYHLPAAHFTFFSDAFYKVLFVEQTHEVNYTILRATESTLIIYMSSLIFFHYFIGVLFSLLARTYVCAPCVYSALRGQKRTLGPVELELHLVVSHCVGAGIQTWVL